MNVFYYLTYEGMVDLDEISDLTQRRVRPLGSDICSARRLWTVPALKGDGSTPSITEELVMETARYPCVMP